MKECFKCGVKKELSEFYKHNGMADGHLNKCKRCAQLDVLKIRYKNLDYYREYDKNRAMSPERVESRLSYAKTEDGMHSARLAKARWVAKNPEVRKETVKKWNDANKVKRSAQAKVAHRIRVGKMIRMPCIICKNKKSHAHHEDYLKPYDVIWLCAQCHKDRHKGIVYE